MELENYLGKRVSILSRLGKTWRGFAESMSQAQDEEDGIEKLYLDDEESGRCIEFPKNDIVSIKEIN